MSLLKSGPAPAASASRAFTATACMALATLTAAGTAGQPLEWAEDGRLDPPSPVQQMSFGNDVALVGDLLLVGARRETINGSSDTGAAYLYDLALGSLRFKLTHPDLPDQVNFGTSVDIDGRTAVVGAPSDGRFGPEAGAAFGFDLTTGEVTSELRVPIPPSFGGFGSAVAISGDRAVVGAPFPQRVGIGPGRAFLFDARRGALLQEFVIPNPQGSDQFGTSVAISGDLVLVGAPGIPAALNRTRGSVYGFDANTGAFRFELQGETSGADGNRFGLSMDVDDQYILVGAPGEFGSLGAAYRFDRSNTKNRLRLGNPDPDTLQQYGRSIALGGGAVFIGTTPIFASFDEALFVLDAATGEVSQQFTLTPPDSPGDFGIGVAATADRLAVGAPAVTRNRILAGSTFLYAPVPGQLRVSPAPLIGGAEATFELFVGTPNARTWILYSLSGLSPTPVLIPRLNVLIDLDSAAIAVGPLRTDSDGNAVVRGRMVNTNEPAPIWFQAVQDYLVSNHVETEIIRGN